MTYAHRSKTPSSSTVRHWKRSAKTLPPPNGLQHPYGRIVTQSFQPSLRDWVENVTSFAMAA